MKIKYIWAFVATFATALGFTSCKDEYEKIIWDSSRMGSEAKIEGRAQNLSALQGSTIYTNSITINAKGSDGYGEHFWYSDVQSATTKLELKYGIVGKGDTVCINATEHTIALEPFEEYFIQSISYGVDKDGNRCFEGDTTNVIFYHVPQLKMTLSHTYGAGKSNGVYLEWNFNAEGENKAKVEKVLEAKSEQIVSTIAISSTEVDCNVEPLTIEGSDNAIIFPYEVGIDSTTTKKLVNIGGENVLLYIDAYKYNFRVTVQIPIGDRMVTIGESAVKSIFVNTNHFAVDDELNVYRTMRIGNDIWTIDNFRGKLSKWAQQVKTHNGSYFYGWGYKYWNDNVSTEINSKIEGYHVSTENDWNRLEESFEFKTKKSEFWPYDVRRISSYSLNSVLDCDNDTVSYKHNMEYYFADNFPWGSVIGVSNKEEEIYGVSSFNAQLTGFYYTPSSFEYEGDAAMFMVCSNGEKAYYRVLSKNYKSMCKYDAEDDVYCSVRLVKDR